MTKMTEMPADFHRRPPADPTEISKTESKAGFGFPAPYKEFLLETNGGEGPVGEAAFIMLWPVEDLIELNEGYQVAKYAPGLFLIGSDGGGEGLAFDLQSEEMRLVFVPFVGMDRSLIEPVAPKFETLFTELAKLED